MDLHIKSKQLDQAQTVDAQILAFKEKYQQLTGPSYAEFLHKHAELLVLQEQFSEAEKASLQAMKSVLSRHGCVSLRIGKPTQVANLTQNRN
ncbi:hypothetical protein ACO0LC_11335 [Undibacterium sp. JH2W]|uniref:hypothetical protein n=1 Tax=Undibacterium sp. JH2W TaxID=3413037 RepID=UPI003BF219E4